MFVRAGLELKETFFGLTRLGVPSLAVGFLVDRISQFGHNGPWDAERFHGKYVDDYADYATIAIGLYMAAAGVPFQLSLLSQNIYAARHSTHNEPTDRLYRWLSQRDIRNTQIGYELYRSGRIARKR